MRLPIFLLGSAAAANAAVSELPKNAIHDASLYRTLVSKTSHGTHYRHSPPSTAPLDVLHVFGTSYERGEAHGRLISAQLLDFVGPKLDTFYGQQILALIGGCMEVGQKCSLPKWLVEAIRLLRPTVNRNAPKAFNLALGWLEEMQRTYNNASASRVYDEMRGIADGACAVSNAAGTACDPTALRKKLNRINVLSDLIKMQCTVFGAWGAATPDGQLTQLRALDFGDGPFANATLLVVHHPTSESVGHHDSQSGSQAPVQSPPPQPFASLGFPGFVGVITGLSPSLAISEKVNDLHGGGTPPGSYEGQSVAYVMRDMLQFGTSKEAAHTIAAKAERTWGVWLGVGDAAEGKFDVIRYTKASVDIFDDVSLPALTGGPRFADVAYIDKHAQPSLPGKDTSLPDAIRARLGQLNGTVVAQNLPRIHETGDVHIMVVDSSSKHVLFSKGTTSANGTFVGAGARKAFESPFVRFAQKDLWDEPPPSGLV